MPPSESTLSLPGALLPTAPAHATQTRIAAGLEQAFAAGGFAQPNVETLRAAAGVSLRTLYKYAPSRQAMVLLALEHRHQRYMKHLFEPALPDPPAAALAEVLARLAAWMAQEASHGCLFHAAVAAMPNDADLRALLTRHKAEVARRVAGAIGQPDRQADVTLLLEGSAQAWPLLGLATLESARSMGAALLASADEVCGRVPPAGRGMDLPPTASLSCVDEGPNQ